MRNGVVVMIGVMVLVPLRVSAQQNACALLTDNDIEVTTGATGVDAPDRMDVPITAGPMKGDTMFGCSWSADDSTMVSVSVMPAATGAARNSGLAEMEKTTDSLVAQRWTEDTRDFPDGSCSVLAPPDDHADMPAIGQCYLVRDGKVLAVAFMRAGAAPSLGQMKALLDRAVDRLY